MDDQGSDCPRGSTEVGLGFRALYVDGRNCRDVQFSRACLELFASARDNSASLGSHFSCAKTSSPAMLVGAAVVISPCTLPQARLSDKAHNEASADASQPQSAGAKAQESPACCLLSLRHCLDFRR